jgi:hypothetical protein
MQPNGRTIPAQLFSSRGAVDADHGHFQTRIHLKPPEKTNPYHPRNMHG